MSLGNTKLIFQACSTGDIFKLLLQVVASICGSTPTYIEMHTQNESETQYFTCTGLAGGPGKSWYFRTFKKISITLGFYSKWVFNIYDTQRLNRLNFLWFTQSRSIKIIAEIRFGIFVS